LRLWDELMNMAILFQPVTYRLISVGDGKELHRFVAKILSASPGDLRGGNAGSHWLAELHTMSQ
jgi:hypothetical protein